MYKQCFRKYAVVAMAALATLVTGCGGGNGTSSSSATTPATTTPSTTTPIIASPTVSVAVTTLSGAATSKLTSGAALVASATVKNSAGKLIEGAVVTFSGDADYVAYTPAKGTALTGSNGVASVTLNASSLSSSGATTIQASAQYSDGDTSITVASPPYGLAIGSANVTLGAMSVGTASISAYGSTSVSVPVLINGAPATVPVTVNFSSACIQSKIAKISTPVTSVNGVATTTYTDNNCASAPGGETVTASVSGANAVATGTVIALAPVANNLQFVSATPSILATKGTGSASLPQSSVVKFKVVDAKNNPVSGKSVNFSLMPISTTSGVQLSSSTAVSDGSGDVSVSVTSGPVPTPVWVYASLENSSPIISSQSNALTITTGLPTQNFFSLSVNTFNIEGARYDGMSSTLSVIASDRLGNPVPDHTVINFISEGGQIQGGSAGRGSCETTAGSCSVTMKSAEYRPFGETVTSSSGTVGAVPVEGITFSSGPLAGQPLYVRNGRVSILAYALGEKSFVDTNGNNKWDAGETFYDLGDLFLDSNENSLWDSGVTQPNLGEQYIAYPQTASYTKPCMTQLTGTTPYTTTALPENYYNAQSKAETCSGIIDNASGMSAYVRRSAVVVFSDSFGQISEDQFSMNGFCSGSFGFWLMDSNYNPMPFDTKLSVAGNAIMYTPVTGDPPAETTAAVTMDSTSVRNTTHAGGTWHSFTITSTGCDIAGKKNPAGSFLLNIKTPLGNETNIPITILNGF